MISNQGKSQVFTAEARRRGVLEIVFEQFFAKNVLILRLHAIRESLPKAETL
jgi:hypothetical protein